MALIEAAGQTVTVRRYLENAPSAAEITDMLAQLGIDDPRAIMRRGEAIYKEKNLKAETDPDALIRAMAAAPILIERPIVSDGRRAILGRPPEKVNELLG